VLLPVLFIAAFAIFVLIHLSGILGVFQNVFYTSFLMPLMFLSLSAQLFYLSEGTKPQQVLLIGCSIAILALPLAFSQAVAQVFHYWHPLSLFPALVFTLIGVVILSLQWEVVGKTLFCLLMFSLANLSIYPENPVPFTASNTAASYHAIVDTYDAI